MSVTISSPGDLVALVPVLVGFVPRESVIVVGLTRGGALGPVMRADVADCAVPDVVQDIAATLCGALARAGAPRAVVVGYADSGAEPAVRAIADAVASRVEVADELVVSAGRFRSLCCADLQCCPPEGTEVPQLAGGALGAVNPVHGARATRRAPSASRRGAVRARERALTARERDPVGWRHRRLTEWRDALRGAQRGTELAPAAAGRIAAGLRDITVRDAAVVDMVPGESEVADRLCATGQGLGVREALAAMVTIEDAVAPVPATVDAVVAVARRTAWLCEADVAPALTLAGVGQWWAGNDRDAARSIAVALDAQPDYRLAHLVRTAIEAGMPPGWLARR